MYRAPVFRFVPLLAVLLLTACRGGDTTASASVLTDDDFIEVMVELREAERAVEAADSAAELFATRKAGILEQHGTTEDEIRAYVQAASRDLRALDETWNEISERLRRPVRSDSTALP